jgi:hypothetical protein
MVYLLLGWRVKIGNHSSLFNRQSSFEDLFIRQITSRVRSPEVTGGRFSPYPEITAAEIKPSALGASAFDEMFFFLEPGHKRVVQVCPDAAERALFNVTEAVVPPELISMN